MSSFNPGAPVKAQLFRRDLILSKTRPEIERSLRKIFDRLTRFGMTQVRDAVSKIETGLERWERTIDFALKDQRWHEHDLKIQRAVAEYNRHLSPTSGYVPLDWLLIKAMVWTESGGPTNRAWADRPMQIGNPGDPGLKSLLHGDEGGELILPPSFKASLTMLSAIGSAEQNIRAGIGYLLMRLAKFKHASVLSDSDQRIYEELVRPGDTLTRVAARTGTTIEVLRKHNADTLILRAGQNLKYRKARIQKVVAGWEAATTTRIATTYNVGDPMYAAKLQYCLPTMRKVRVRQ